MLAITHHYIVQFCAWTAGVVPVGKIFSQYCVLGDDIIIWNRPVALTYLRWMDILGVEIGLAKSVISPKGKGLEFAKRTLIDGEDVSPIPFKEQSSAHRNMASGIQFSIKYNMSMLEYIRFLGYGYKVDPSKSNRFVDAVKIALAIPTERNKLLEVFTTDRPYIDLEGHSHPVQIIRKTLVDLVFDELVSLEKLSKDYLFRINSFSIELQLNQYDGPTERIRNSVVSYYTPKIISDLEWIRRTCKFFLYHNKYIFLFYESFMWRTLFGLSSSERLQGKNFKGAITFMFEGRKALEKVQLEPLISPSRGFGVSPSYEEDQNVLRL
jgi:hypothetical protein